MLSEHHEVAVIGEDVPGPVLVLGTKISDFFDERRVLVVTPIHGHVFGQPGWERREAVRRLCLEIPRDMDDHAALLVPSRGLDSWSYPLVVDVLDGMPPGVWTLFQGVFDDVRPDNDRFEDPAIGLVPAQAGTENAGEHADQLLLRCV
ncbi:MAG TPA: hypothetical protein VL485_14170 [Ktedonobacteraceae bacterium]|nr:hypothetical protein [Ktedonobacteraceae bacterium]